MLLQQRALVLMGKGQATLPNGGALDVSPAPDDQHLTAPGILM